MEIKSPYDDDVSAIVSPYSSKKFGIEDTQQAPKSPIQTPSGWDILGALATGTKKFVGGVLGTPVDMINIAMMGAGGSQPVGGSASINNLLSEIIPDSQAPKGLATNVASKVGEYLPSAMLGPIFGGRAALTNIGKSTAAGVPSAIGGGVGAGVAETMAPDNPWVQLVGAIIGGVAPAVGQSTYINKFISPDVTKRIDKVLNGVAPITKADVGSSVSGKSIIEARKGSAEGVKSFVLANRDKPFIYRDIEGTVISSGLPFTRMETAEALDQLKVRIYTNYNDIQRKAGQQGLMFDGDAIANKIAKMVSNDFEAGPSAVAMSPYLEKEATKYAGKQWTPQQIENELAHLNAKLKAHMKSQNPNQVSTAAMDNKILSALRQELDDGITRLEGEGYGIFRDQYKNVRALQDRIGKAAIAQMKEEATPSKGPFGIFEMGLGAGTAYGMAHDPMYALAGAAVYGGKSIAKHMVQPDRRLRNMFKHAEKYLPPKEQWGPLLTPERPMPGAQFGQKQLERPIIEGEVIPTQKQLPPMPTNMLPSPGRTADVKPVNAPWNPSLRTGQTPVVTNNTTVQQAAPFDFDAAMSNMKEMGYSPVEARDMLLSQIKAELSRRKGM